jgi:hypothetical protein
MKKIVSTLFSLFLLTCTYAQKTEFGISLNSGLFSFAGASSGAITGININSSSSTNTGYTNNPWGSKVGLCYGISANIKQVTKKNLVLGLDLGYEVLRSKVSINSVWISNDEYYDAEGQTFLNNDFINLFPQIGYRFNTKEVSFDLVAGCDIAFCLSATEKGDAKASNGIRYTTSIDRIPTNKDFRPRVQLTANYKKAGIYVGYSYGLSNYKKKFWGGVNEAYSRLFRFGLTYRLK